MNPPNGGENSPSINRRSYGLAVFSRHGVAFSRSTGLLFGVSMGICPPSCDSDGDGSSILLFEPPVSGGETGSSAFRYISVARYKNTPRIVLKFRDTGSSDISVVQV